MLFQSENLEADEASGRLNSDSLRAGFQGEFGRAGFSTAFRPGPNHVNYWSMVSNVQAGHSGQIFLDNSDAWGQENSAVEGVSFAPVTFAAIDAPGKAYADASAPLAEGRKHECYVTSLISAIYAAAAEVKDYRTMQFLDWFVKEQGEEEKNADDLVKKMKLFGGDPKGLYLLDQELAARVYTPSTPTGN